MFKKAQRRAESGPYLQSIDHVLFNLLSCEKQKNLSAKIEDVNKGSLDAKYTP